MPTCELCYLAAYKLFYCVCLYVWILPSAKPVLSCCVSHLQNEVSGFNYFCSYFPLSLHTHSLSLVLVAVMKSKELKTKISHANSLTLSLPSHCLSTAAIWVLRCFQTNGSKRRANSNRLLPLPRRRSLLHAQKPMRSEHN